MSCPSCKELREEIERLRAEKRSLVQRLFDLRFWVKKNAPKENDGD